MYRRFPLSDVLNDIWFGIASVAGGAPCPPASAPPAPTRTGTCRHKRRPPARAHGRILSHSQLLPARSKTPGDFSGSSPPKKKSFEPLGWVSLSHRTRAKLEPSACLASNKPAELCLPICRGGFGSPGALPAAGAAHARCPCPHLPKDSLPAPKLAVKSAWKEKGILKNKDFLTIHGKK